MSSMAPELARPKTRFFYQVNEDRAFEALHSLFLDLEADGMIPSYVNEVTSVEQLESQGGQAASFITHLVMGLLKSPAIEPPHALTIVRERLHIDATYRDSFYTYFSQQHFRTQDVSSRITIFAGLISDQSWHDECDAGRARPLASCVVNPLEPGAIGRTLIDPGVWIHDERVSLRLSDFKINVYGHPFIISAFPYRKQDVESNRCAEVTLINLIEYYANEYPDYALVRGSGIRDLEERYTYERNTPSRGISYLTFTRVLSDLGFYPRLYAASSLPTGRSWSDDPDDSFQRVMHYYVESGIPVAVNPAPDSTGDGHSLLCVGYRQWGDFESAARRADKSAIVFDCYTREGVIADGRPTNTPRATEVDVRSRKGEGSGIAHSTLAISLTDSADYFDSYSVIDDNQFPYTIRDAHHLTIQPGMRNAFLVAPLSKRMALDAIDAREKFIALISDPKHGILNWAGSYLQASGNGTKRRRADVVMRVFLASSKHFRRTRVQQIKEPVRRSIYTEIAMPHYVWVCEVYERDSFRAEDPSCRKAFGEIVIDATSVSSNSITGNVIIMNYPELIGFRTPESRTNALEHIHRVSLCLLSPYQDNLKVATAPDEGLG